MARTTQRPTPDNSPHKTFTWYVIYGCKAVTFTLPEDNNSISEWLCHSVCVSNTFFCNIKVMFSRILSSAQYTSNSSWERAGFCFKTLSPAQSSKTELWVIPSLITSGPGNSRPESVTRERKENFVWTTLLLASIYYSRKKISLLITNRPVNYPDSVGSLPIWISIPDSHGWAVK